MNYLYDGTFEGFLTCVREHYYREKAEGIFAGGDYQLDLLRYAATVCTDAGKAEIVYRAIAEKISKWDAERIYRVHCTNEPEKEMKLLRYIRLGFKNGARIRLLHGHPVVLDVQKAEQRFGAEVHRLCGLIRFSEVRGGGGPEIPEGAARPEGIGAPGALAAAVRRPASILYAPVEPDNDVLEFLAPHFTDRFKSEPFIIHDKRRGKALFAYEREWHIAPLAAENEPSRTKAEEDICGLWRQYFEIMATKERINPKGQRRFMPARYWKHLTEI
jgi:probable DNA metabolism protein